MKFFRSLFLLFLLFFGRELLAFSIEKIDGVEDRNDFVLHPAKVEIEVLPGEIKTSEFKVTNRSSKRADFSVEFEDIQQPEDPSLPITTTILSRGKLSVSQFLSTEIPEFSLSPGEQATFSVKINIPKTVKSGSHSGAVLVSGNYREADGGANKIVSRVGSLIFIKVPALSKDDALIDNGKYVDFSHNEGKFSLTFDNSGDTVLNPYGIVEITDLWGNSVEKIPLDPWYVLQKSKRTREIAWNKDIKFPFLRVNALLYPGYGGMEKIERYNFLLFSDGFYFFMAIIVIFFILLFVYLFKKRSKIKK